MGCVTKRFSYKNEHLWESNSINLPLFHHYLRKASGFLDFWRKRFKTFNIWIIVQHVFQLNDILMIHWRPIAQFIILSIDLSCFGPIPGSISIKMGPEAHQLHRHEKILFWFFFSNHHYCRWTLPNVVTIGTVLRNAAGVLLAEHMFASSDNQQGQGQI